MTEDAFLNVLRESPGDDATRLVFADWLEEQGDETSILKAKYLRLDAKMAASPRLARHRGKNHERRQLARELPAGWLAVVSRAKIELCEFRFECPEKWERLRPIAGSTTERHCDKCDKAVTYCASIGEARRHAAAGGCVAIDARVVRSKGDLYVAPEGLTTVGILDMNFLHGGGNPWEEAQRLRDEIEGMRDE